MAALSPASKKAIANLRAFTPPPTNYYKCPLKRRAAVLILLIADRGGDLRVVLTIRSSGLRNYAGQAALPGGKADTLQETPFGTARREAWEEIGLPESESQLPSGYSVEHLTELPTNLAMTELGVRPCVAWLKAPAPSAQRPEPDAARDLLPKLDAKEVAAVFTAPFHNFLRDQDEDLDIRRRVPGEWYRGTWHSWNDSAWRMHSFSVPVSPTTVLLARKPVSYPYPRPTQATRRRTIPSQKSSSSHTDEGASSKKEELGSSQSASQALPALSSAPASSSSSSHPPSSHPAAVASPSSSSSSSSSRRLQPPLPRSFYQIPDDALSQPRYRVFGMTARILVDAARVAYGEEPNFEHNSHFGDEDMIQKLLSIGRLNAVKKEGETLDRDTLKRASDVKL